MSAEPARILLDTHVVLWLGLDSPRLGPTARKLIAGAGQVSVSAASVWEIAIKASTGKLNAPADPLERIEATGVDLIAITPEDAWAIHDVELPHRDPFDQMLVAQARRRGLSLLTADGVLLASDLPIESIDARV